MPARSDPLVMRSNLAAAASDRLVWGRSVTVGAALLAFVPALVAVGLFKLAISDGGRHLESLTLVQTGLLLSVAVLVWAGATRSVAVTPALLAILGAVAVASVSSVRPDSSLREILLWVTYVSVFVATASTLRTLQAASRFVDALVVIAGWVCLVGLFLFWGADKPGMRWYSTFYWPNPFAAFLLLVIPLELSRLVHAESRRDVAAHGAMLVLLGVPFVLTYSRGAWLVLVAILPVAAVLSQPRSRVVALIRVALAGVVVAGFVILLTRGAALSSSPQAVVGRVVSVANASDNSIQGRFHFWRSGLAIFRDNPLLGTGPRTYAYVSAKYQRDVRYFASDPHSLYVQMAAEMGVLGVAALAVLLFFAASLCVRTLRRSRGTEEYPVVVGICLGLAAFFLHSGIDMDWPFPVNPAMAFAFLAVLAAYDRHLSPNQESAAGMIRPAARRRAVMIAGLVAAVIVAQTLQVAQRKLLEGTRLLSAGRWADAVAAFRESARFNPLDPKPRDGLAIAREHLGAEKAEVTALIKQSMSLDRMNAYYPVRLAGVLSRSTGPMSSGRAEAVALLRKALVLDPYHYPDAYQLLARIYAETGRPRDAESVYQEARARYGRGLTHDDILVKMLWPGVARLYMDWARLLTAQERLEDALGIYRDILEEDPRYVPAYVAAANIFLWRNREQDASAVLARGLDEVPASEVLWRKWRTLPVNRTVIWEQ